MLIGASIKTFVALAVLFLAGNAAHAYFIEPQPAEYEKYCSSTAPSDKLAICINDPSDIRHSIVDTSPGLVDVMTDDVKNVAIFVGDSVGKSVWIQTTKYRAYFSIWSVNDNLSVGYSVASITGAVSTGQFFRGDAPVQLG